MISVAKPIAMTTDADPAPRIRVQIVHALPGTYWATHVLLPQVATVADALESARSAIDAAGIGVDTAGLAIFGKSVETRTRLHDGDRIELLRPLLVSPRDARTSRASATRKR
jgi:putative ubiquitin-RnfH superfamily antitoxin RatB of RatAB toxin-antitoxin module